MTAAGLPALLLLGFTVASIGGPIALLTIFPGVAGDGADSAGLVVALSLAVFAAPLAIWLAYSRRVVGDGGLTAFVADAAGRRVALAHGWIWAFSYFLYLPFTITYVVYELLPPVFPGMQAYRTALELLLPVAIVAVVALPLRAVLVALGLLAAAEVIALLVLAGFEYVHAGSTFVAHANVNDTGRAVGGTALLYVCASLPLYLGGAVRGGATTMRWVLAAGVAIVGAAFLVAAIPMSGVPDSLRDAAVPGAAIARAYSGRDLEIVVGLLTVLGTLALVVAEYLALARLFRWMHGIPLRISYAWIAVPFIALDAISLADPYRFYDDALKPSLGALFVSQIAVYLVFPRLRKSPVALGAVLVSSALFGWGLYTLVGGSASS